MTNSPSQIICKLEDQLIAEYSTQLSQTPNTSYLTTDHLGSPRIQTNASGQVISRHDYQPFGEEIARANYGADEIRKKFTSYERDKETNLDFAQARMFQSGFGRFTSPDPLQASARASMPQTWNRFSYVLNNPLRFIDPDGMDVQFLDEKARANVLKTLPEEIREKVAKQIDGKGVIKKDALNKIKSKDQNFQDLKTMVNNNALTEVATATNAMPANPANFYQRTGAEQKEKDIQEYMQFKNVSREQAEKDLTTSNNPTWEGDSSFLGYTLSPSESPSGNLLILVTDQTGEASNVSEEEAVATTAHELYGHGMLYRQGKPYGHGQGPPESFFEGVEERTRKNYQNGKQKATTPTNIKPKL